MVSFYLDCFPIKFYALDNTLPLLIYVKDLTGKVHTVECEYNESIE